MVLVSWGSVAGNTSPAVVPSHDVRSSTQEGKVPHASLGPRLRHPRLDRRSASASVISREISPISPGYFLFVFLVLFVVSLIFGRGGRAIP